MDKLKPYLPWILRAATFTLVLILVYSWNSAHRARAELSELLEREKIEKAKLVAELEVKQRDLNAAEKSILAWDTSFAEEKDRLTKALGEKPKPEIVVQWKTREVPVATPVAGPPEPPRECPPADKEGKPSKEIMLLDGDTGHVEVNEVTYETRETNHVFIATGSCWRDTPSRRLLFRSSVEGPAPVAMREKDDDPYRWGAGAYLGGGKDGWVLGPELAFPPQRLFGLQGELNLGGGIGPTGAWQVGTTGILRWR